MRNALLIYVLICCSLNVVAQTLVRKSFEFLQVSPAARLSALGGVNVSLADRDVNFFQYNPSLAGDTLSGVASVSYQFYVAGISNSSVVYTHHFKSAGTFTFGVQHFRYGTIDSYDAVGNSSGEFNAGETVMAVSKAHHVGNFRLGAMAKFAFSNLAGYRAGAILFTAGGLFVHPDKDLTVGLAVQNVGFVVNDYTPTSETKLPFDVQLGTTFKPEHLPVRFSVSVYRLTAPSAGYDSLYGIPEASAFDRVLQHFNFGAEILVHRNVDLLVGYNYGVHRDMRLEDGGGTAGLSLGFSVRVRSLEFNFSRTTYTVGQAGYAFSLSQDLHKLLRKT